MSQPILNDERDKRSWAWICDRVGESAALAAIERLAGNRKPYVSNIAKVLGLSIPADVSNPAPTKTQQLDRIQSIRRQLGL